MTYPGPRAIAQSASIRYTYLSCGEKTFSSVAQRASTLRYNSVSKKDWERKPLRSTDRDLKCPVIKSSMSVVRQTGSNYTNFLFTKTYWGYCGLAARCRFSKLATYMVGLWSDLQVFERWSFALERRSPSTRCRRLWFWVWLFLLSRLGVGFQRVSISGHDCQCFVLRMS